MTTTMRMKRSDRRVTDLGVAFARVFGSARSFTHYEIGVVGFSDGREGVQWNAWYNLDSGRAFCGVNLEGKEYTGWPLARLLARELHRPLLFSAIEQTRDPSQVQVRLWRDVWIAGVKHRSIDDELRPTPVSIGVLTGSGWDRALRSAWRCAPNHAAGGGVARPDVTLLRSGKTKPDATVTPHLQFKTLLWEIPPTSQTVRARRLREVKSLLEPVHAFVMDRSRVEGTPL